MKLHVGWGGTVTTRFGNNDWPQVEFLRSRSQNKESIYEETGKREELSKDVTSSDICPSLVFTESAGAYTACSV